jgi:hypothetical protein
MDHRLPSSLILPDPEVIVKSLELYKMLLARVSCAITALRDACYGSYVRFVKKAFPDTFTPVPGNLSDGVASAARLQNRT